MLNVAYSRNDSIKIDATEVYNYAIEMDSNPSITAKTAEGFIDIAIPCEQIQRFYRRIDLGNAGRQRPTSTRLGRLYVTNLPDAGPPDSVQPSFQDLDLVVPLQPSSSSQQYSEFLYRAHHYLDRFPDTAPWQWPFEVTVDVFDEFLMANSVREAVIPDRLDQGITENSQFQRQLVLWFRIRVAVPRKSVDVDELKPVLSFASVDWPVGTSYHVLDVTCEGKNHPFRYNASNSRVEWKKNNFHELHARDLKPDQQYLLKTLQLYQVTNLRLSIKEPGEFYRRVDPVTCKLEITIPDCLLSGTQMDFFDARGIPWSRHDPPKINRKSVIKIEMPIDLHARFQCRTLSPLYEFHFEGLILKKEQIQAIENILQDIGFAQTSERYSVNDGEVNIYSRSFECVNQQNVLKLWVHARCITKTSYRETEIPGGRRYTTPVETGNTEIALRAEMKGAVNRLTEMMNAIHRALEAHFQYMTPPD